MGSPMSALKREGYCVVWVHWVQTKPGAESMRPPQKLRPAQRFGHRSQCHAAAGGWWLCILTVGEVRQKGLRCVYGS